MAPENEHTVLIVPSQTYSQAPKTFGLRKSPLNNSNPSYHLWYTIYQRVILSSNRPVCATWPSLTDRKVH
jgi:hypothetical protein